VATYSTNEFRKGLKIQIDGIPFQMIEMNFRKPGKGTALYECKLKNLLRGTVTDRTYKAGQSLEAADVSEFTAQYLYRQPDGFVFMDNEDYEQYELSEEQVGDNGKFLKADRGDIAQPCDFAGRILRADDEGKHGHQCPKTC